MPKSNYVGSLSNVRDSGGVRHGQGTYTYSNFYSYSGSWSNGVKDGKGKVSRSLARPVGTIKGLRGLALRAVSA